METNNRLFVGWCWWWYYFSCSLVRRIHLKCPTNNLVNKLVAINGYECSLTTLQSSCNRHLALLLSALKLFPTRVENVTSLLVPLTEATNSFQVYCFWKSKLRSRVYLAWSSSRGRRLVASIWCPVTLYLAIWPLVNQSMSRHKDVLQGNYWGGYSYLCAVKIESHVRARPGGPLSRSC